MTLLQQILIFLIICLFIYCIVDRICKCAETCAMAKAYGKFVETQDLKKDISNLREEAKKLSEID